MKTAAEPAAVDGKVASKGMISMLYGASMKLNEGDAFRYDWF